MHVENEKALEGRGESEKEVCQKGRQKIEKLEYQGRQIRRFFTVSILHVMGIVGSVI